MVLPTYMQNPMKTERRLRLAMVPVIEKPVSPARRWAEERAVPAFDVTRLLQQTGIVVVMIVLSVVSYYLISHYGAESRGGGVLKMAVDLAGRSQPLICSIVLGLGAIMTRNCGTSGGAGGPG